jgi:hypothetical protein
MARAPRTPPVPGLLPGILPGASLTATLLTYKTESGITGKGQIATMIYASRLARRTGLPFDVEGGITTEGEGKLKVSAKVLCRQF